MRISVAKAARTLKRRNKGLRAANQSKNKDIKKISNGSATCMTIQLSPDQYALAVKLAALWGVSVDEAVSRAVSGGMADRVRRTTSQRRSAAVMNFRQED